MLHWLKALLAGALMGLVACGGGGTADAPPAPPPPAPIDRALVQAVADWNDTVEAALAEADAPSSAEWFLYPMAALAAHDALNGIDARFARWLDGAAPRADANARAAVATAVRDVIVATLPSTASSMQVRYDAALAEVPAGSARDAGIEVGAAAAARVLAARGTNLGANTEPFGLASRQQIRVAPPYGVADSEPDIHVAATRTAAFAADYNEVRCIGRNASVPAGDCTLNRSADQDEIARFWIESCTFGWNRIARTVAASRTDLDGWRLARLLALLHVAVTDGQIASIYNKGLYEFWRPDAATAGAADDDNPATTPVPGWIPVRPTPASPDYPSAHATGGAAAVAVLIAEFGDVVAFSTTSTSLAGATRTYASFSEAARENALSRIYVGFHFRHATDVGLELGRQVGEAVLAARLRAL